MVVALVRPHWFAEEGRRPSLSLAVVPELVAVVVVVHQVHCPPELEEDLHPLVGLGAALMVCRPCRHHRHLAG